jgi:hypothetical protein
MCADEIGDASARRRQFRDRRLYNNPMFMPRYVVRIVWARACVCRVWWWWCVGDGAKEMCPRSSDMSSVIREGFNTKETHVGEKRRKKHLGAQAPSSFLVNERIIGLAVDNGTLLESPERSPR